MFEPSAARLRPGLPAWAATMRLPSTTLNSTKATRPNAALAIWISQKVVVGRLE